jgi:hypothetical protein
MMRIAKLALAAVFYVVMIASLTSCKSHGGAEPAHPRLVKLLPFEFDAKNPERKEFGTFTLMSAFQLDSKDRRFGGLSGLSFGSDGKLYMVSDRGHWLSAKPVNAPDGTLLDLVDWQIAPLIDQKKEPVTGLRSDAEALTRARNGSFLVAFETHHRIWRYAAPPDTFESIPETVTLPKQMQRAPGNGGIEGLASLPNGRLVVLTERFANSDGSFKGWLIDGKTMAQVAYIPADGFNVSDCAALDNGDLLVLERRYAFFGIFTARVALVHGQSIRPGAKLSGKELLRIEYPLVTENYEGLAVQQTSAGTMIYLISDDNFNFFQQTLLVQFRLGLTPSFPTELSETH